MRRLAPFAVERRLEVDARGADAPAGGRRETPSPPRAPSKRPARDRRAARRRAARSSDGARRISSGTVTALTRDAERAAGDGQQRALDHQLPHQPRAAGAERRAQREIVLPPWRCARAAGSPRWRRRSAARSRPRPSARRAPAGSAPVSSSPSGTSVIVAGGYSAGQLAAQLGLDRVDVRARGLERRAGLQAADGSSDADSVRQAEGSVRSYPTSAHMSARW